VQAINYQAKGKELGLPQGFHEKMFNFFQWQSRLLGYCLERHGTVVGGPFEDALYQSHEAYFLPEERVAFLQDWLSDASADFVSFYK
jgi:hypothetical protein